MPELPEVETVRKGLTPLCVGQTIQSINIRQPKLRWPVPEHLTETLPGLTIKNITRRSKYLLIETDSSGTLIMHLGMTGICRVLPQETAFAKHDHIIITLSNNSSLRFNDSRRFGAILWTDKPLSEHPLLAHLGPEPLSDDFNAEHIIHHTRKRSVAIKNWLMDSKNVVGVGNIYASESLFAAGISPLLPAGNITTDQAKQLVAAVKHILTKAIKAGGTTLRDFKDTAGKPGYFSQNLKVYGRADQPCYQCNTGISKVAIGNRSSFYCPTCQR